MSEAEETNFLTSIRHSSGEFFKMLAMVKSSNSQCFIKVDLERIRQATLTERVHSARLDGISCHGGMDDERFEVSDSEVFNGQ